MQIFTIGDERHPSWDGAGAVFIGGRQSRQTCHLWLVKLFLYDVQDTEVARALARIPAAHRFVIVEVPNNVLKLFFIVLHLSMTLLT